MNQTWLFRYTVAMFILLIVLAPLWLFPSLQKTLQSQVESLSSYELLVGKGMAWQGRNGYLTVPEDTETALVVQVVKDIKGIKGVRDVTLTYSELKLTDEVMPIDNEEEKEDMSPVEEANSEAVEALVEVTTEATDTTAENEGEVDEVNETDAKEQEAQVTTILDGFNTANVLEFDYKTTELTEASKGALKLYAAELAPYNEVNLVIVGHTDSVGGVDSNMTLSFARAQTVVEELISGGVAKERLLAVGKGETEPIASNETEEGRKQNRRVEILKGDK